MKKRYDLSRSDNYMFTGLESHVCSGSGTIAVTTGFPVKSASVAFSTIPCAYSEPSGYSSSSSSSSEGEDYSLPRVYVSSYTLTGFIVAYAGIPEDIGYIEFTYSAV